MKIAGLYEQPQTIFPVYEGKKPVPPQEPATGFIEDLKKAFMHVDGLQKASDKAQQDLVVGKAQSIHEVMITMEKAAVALELTTAVRQLIVDGYREVMRMQV